MDSPGIETVIKYAYASCSMIAPRKEMDVELQPLPCLIWSEASCADQTEGRTFPVLLDSWASSQRINVKWLPVIAIMEGNDLLNSKILVHKRILPVIAIDIVDFCLPLRSFLPFGFFM